MLLSAQYVIINDESGKRRYLQVTTTTVREPLGWSHLLLQSGNPRHTAGYPFGSLHWTRTTAVVLSASYKEGSIAATCGPLRCRRSAGQRVSPGTVVRFPSFRRVLCWGDLYGCLSLLADATHRVGLPA